MPDGKKIAPAKSTIKKTPAKAKAAPAAQDPAAMDYTVVVEFERPALEEKINQLRAQGAQLLGGVSITAAGTSVVMYAQAVLLPAVVEK